LRTNDNYCYPYEDLVTTIEGRDPAFWMLNLRPTAVQIEQWRADSFDFGETHYQCLANVRQFKLIYNIYRTAPHSGSAFPVTNLAKNLPCVEELHFGINESKENRRIEIELQYLYRDDEISRRSCILRSILDQKFIKLRTLVLENIMTAEKDLLNFLQNADTLQNLRITCLGLHGDDRVLNLMINLALQVRDSGRLEEIRFEGDFFDRSGVILTCDRRGQPLEPTYQTGYNRLTHFEDYICNRKDDFPLHVLEPMDDGKECDQQDSSMSYRKVTLIEG
jgi:hypothetical protein